MSKRAVVFTGIITILLVVGYFLLSTYSVKFLQSKMKEGLGPGVSFTQFMATTRYVAGKGILIEESQSKLKLLEVEEIRIYPAIRSLFSRNVIVNKIILYHPRVFVYRTKDSVFIGPVLKNERKPMSKKEKQFFDITIDKIMTKEGEFIFTDNYGLSPAAKIHLVKIESNIGKVKYPLVKKSSPVALKGKISDEKKGTIKVKGKIDFKNSDMHLQLSLTSADVTKFKPYYKRKIGDIVQKGFVTTTSSVEIQNHVADVSGKMRLFDLQIDENSENILELSPKDISTVVKNNDNQISTDFHAKGNLLDPKFNLSDALFRSVVTNLSKSTGLYFGKKGEKTLKEKIEKEKEKIKDKIKKLF